MVSISNDFKKYDRMIYRSSIIDVDEYVNNKLDEVHRQMFFDTLEQAFAEMKILNADELYDDENNPACIAREICSEYGFTAYPNESGYDRGALDNFLSNITLEEFMQEYKMKEIKQDEYYKPSKVIFKRLHYPYDMFEIDLSKYWNKFQFENTISKRPSDRLNGVDDLDECKIIYIDYVNGKSKLRSRMTGKEFWMPNEYIDENVELHEDFTLDNTFTKMIENYKTL